MAKQAPAQQGMSFTQLVVVALILITMAAAAAGGAFDGLGSGRGSGNQERYSYRYDCNFEDFYGGVEMESWQGSGVHKKAASPNPVGALSLSGGHQPKGISLHVKARSLTPVIPLPAGAKPRLECKIIRIDETTHREKVIKGPQHISSRRVWLQLDARAS